ncbi:Integrase, catalytic region (plasmid) [Burkholderia vietnamiensis G4]|uniref:Integrase, catalytic region n=1 Tax=Burkholderia vietnamiensis (strain G4 / LMG 22486) TaxID=269482 RepID=A4JUT8_BURVG|nr:Integrase, catalytic region [Burkholderia vietnamiensis G4]
MKRGEIFPRENARYFRYEAGRNGITRNGACKPLRSAGKNGSQRFVKSRNGGLDEPNSKSGVYERASRRSGQAGVDGRCWDTYSKVAFAKLYDRKTPLPAADLLNDRVVPFFDGFGIALLRVLTDRGTEYCGNPEHHEYELYLALEDIDHTQTKAKSPQTNGIVERLHKTMLNDFYRIAFCKKIYDSIATLQTDLDAWLDQYDNEREHQGRWCYGKTPMRTFLASLELAKEKPIPH